MQEGLLCKTHSVTVKQQQNVFYMDKMEISQHVSVINLIVVVIHEQPYNQSKSFKWSDSNDADIYNYWNPLFKIATVCICLLRQDRKMGTLTYILSNLNEVHICSLLLYIYGTHISYISLC
jgi:hypothetical protein